MRFLQSQQLDAVPTAFRRIIATLFFKTQMLWHWHSPPFELCVTHSANCHGHPTPLSHPVRLTPKKKIMLVPLYWPPRSLPRAPHPPGRLTLPPCIPILRPTAHSGIPRARTHPTPHNAAALHPLRLRAAIHSVSARPSTLPSRAPLHLCAAIRHRHPPPHAQSAPPPPPRHHREKVVAGQDIVSCGRPKTPRQGGSICCKCMFQVFQTFQEYVAIVSS
jgi:hypothetical protein